MSAKEIIAMEPGSKLDKLVTGSFNEGFSPSTDMNDAWALREVFIEHSGGDFKLIRYCDEYPEHCSWQNGDDKVLVWAKTGPEAITKTIALAARELYGDFHPWTVFPELKDEFTKKIEQLFASKRKPN